MSSNKPILFDQVNLDILSMAKKEAYKNAENYSFEADLLYRLHRYGHSLALSILGIEELGKSIGYYLLYQRKYINIEGRIIFNPDALLIDIQKSHLSKQSLSVIFSLIFQLSSTDLATIKSEIDRKKQKLYYNANKHKFIQNLTDLKLKIKKIRDWQKDLKYIKEMDIKKQNGLYVEIKDSPIHLSLPNKVKSKDAKYALKLLNKYLVALDI
jgi:hypothetical protein